MQRIGARSRKHAATPLTAKSTNSECTIGGWTPSRCSNGIRTRATGLSQELRSTSTGSALYRQESGAAGTHKIEIVESGVARIIFLPAAVELCLDEFEQLRQVIPFDLESPGKAPATERVPKRWSCRLDERRWQEHRDRIAELVRMVDEHWYQAAE